MTDVPAPASPPLRATVPAPQRQPHPLQSTLTLLQANLLVAILGGFRARLSDGHPGPRILAQGLLKLITLVAWERIKKEVARAKDPPIRCSRKRPEPQRTKTPSPRSQ